MPLKKEPVMVLIVLIDPEKISLALVVVWFKALYGKSSLENDIIKVVIQQEENIHWNLNSRIS